MPASTPVPASPSARPVPSDFGSPVLASAPHRVGVVSLVVRDLDLVKQFYQQVLSLRVRETDGSVVRLGTSSDTLVELRHVPEARRRSPREAGLFHTAFLLPSRADLGSWIAFASERQMSIQGASDHLVSEALYLADPEGNGIEIYVDKPREAWPVVDGKLQMATDPLDLRSVYESARGRRWTGYPEGATVGHIHLQVGALGPADQFYGDQLGFDIMCRYPGASFFGSGGYHHQLATNIWNSRGASPVSGTVTGLAGFELVTGDAEVVSGAAKRLEAAGVSHDLSAGRLTVADPWGTRVTLAARQA